MSQITASRPRTHRIVTGPKSTGHRGFLDWLFALDATHRQRRALARLDARLRADVGLSQSAVADETARPAWDAPGWWR